MSSHCLGGAVVAYTTAKLDISYCIPKSLYDLQLFDKLNKKYLLSDLRKSE